jgi:YHS domain-containing protein
MLRPIEMRDPVCGKLQTGESDYEATYRDRNYVFCSEPCRNKFIQNPKWYVPYNPLPEVMQYQVGFSS